MQTGVNRFNVNPKDGIAFLIEEGLIADTAESICGFLSSVEGLSKRRLGDYFGRVSGGVLEDGQLVSFGCACVLCFVFRFFGVFGARKKRELRLHRFLR